MDLLSAPLTSAYLLITILTSYRAFTDIELKRKFIFNPYLVKNHNQWYRALSHGIIHSGPVHLFFNMFVLYSFGMFVEYQFVGLWGELEGRLCYLALYVGGLLFATLPAFTKHHNNPGYNSLGASGAVYAVLIAAILLNPLNDLLLMFFIPIKAWIAGILIFFFESYMNKKGGTRIAHDAHLAGAIYGLILVFLLDYKIFIHFSDQVSNYLGF